MEKEEYNNIPVSYCPHCLSLRIVEVEDTDLLCCDECGNTDILETNIEEWKKLYKEKYGVEFLNKK